MGGSSYSDASYSAKVSSTKSSHGSAFAHHTLIKSGKVQEKVNEILDVSIASKATGKKLRESRDSEAHPNSNAIIVAFDVTGSMGHVPRIFVDKLPKLMSVLIKKGWLPDPQIMFAAVGDAYSDRVPLQVGQFESGEEMADALSSIYLEGRGGSQFHESYELAAHYFLNHTAMDCHEKRGKKGYLFFLGDEMPYDKLNPKQVERIIGETVQDETPIEELLELLRNKFEVFWIFPNGGSYFGQRGKDVGIHDRLTELFGQSLIWMEDSETICEVIASAIGASEGYDINEIKDGLAEAGSDNKSIILASSAVANISNKSIKKASVTGDLGVATDVDDVERL